MDSVGESNCFRSRSNTWPKNPGLDTSLRSGLGRKYIYGNQTYADLIEKAIEASPTRRLTLSEIYQWLADNVPHFKDKTISPLSWKNSVRHNLSLHGKFLRVQVDRKSMWTIHPNPSEANNGRRRLHRGSGRNKRQVNREHSYCNYTTSHYKNEEFVCQARASTLKHHSPDQNRQLQPDVGSYSSPTVDQTSQEGSCLQRNTPSVVDCHTWNQQQPIPKPTAQFIENVFPFIIKQEFSYPDCRFRPRSYSSSSSVSRSSLASSVDEAAANFDWPGSRQRTPAVAAYFSSFRPDEKHEHEANLFAESKQNCVQFPTNLEIRAEIVLPLSLKAEYNNSDTSFSFRQRSSSCSNDQLSKLKAFRTLNSRPKIHLQDVPHTKYLVENGEPFKPRLSSCSTNMPLVGSADNMGDTHNTWSTKSEGDSLEDNLYQQQQFESYGTSRIRSSVYPKNFINDSAYGTSRSPRLYIQDDPKSKHLIEHSEPFRQRSNSNPNSRLYAATQQSDNQPNHRVHMLDKNDMQQFRSRSNSNPVSKRTDVNKDTGKNRYLTLTETMSPMIERLRLESSDHVLSSDFSNINLEPLNFQENLDIGNIIRHELSIDGILDFS